MFSFDASEPPPIDDVALSRRERGGEPVEVPLVDDPLTAGGVLRLEPGDRLLDLVDQLVADRRLSQHVVGRDADLAGVDQLGPRDPLRGDLDVGVFRHDDRALAAELQGDRRQMRRRALVHLAPDLGAAGEQQMVEALRDELLADGAIALDDGDRVGVEVARHELGHQRRRRGRHLRWLEHQGVTRGDRADGGTQRQREREVPGADDQHGAVWLVLHPAAAGQLRHLEQAVAALGPLAHVFRGVRALAAGAGDIGEPGLERRPPQVLLQCVGDLGLVLDHQLLECAQLLLAPLQIAGTTSGERLAKPCDRLGHIGADSRGRGCSWSGGFGGVGGFGGHGDSLPRPAETQS